MVGLATPLLSTRVSPGRRLRGRNRWGRRKGAGEHDGLVIAAALAWRSGFNARKAPHGVSRGRDSIWFGR